MTTITRKPIESREADEYCRTLRFMAEYLDEIEKPGVGYRTYEMVANEVAQRMGMKKARA